MSNTGYQHVAIRWRVTAVYRPESRWIRYDRKLETVLQSGAERRGCAGAEVLSSWRRRHKRQPFLRAICAEDGLRVHHEQLECCRNLVETGDHRQLPVQLRRLRAD